MLLQWRELGGGGTTELASVLTPPTLALFRERMSAKHFTPSPRRRQPHPFCQNQLGPGKHYYCTCVSRLSSSFFLSRTSHGHFIIPHEKGRHTWIIPVPRDGITQAPETSSANRSASWGRWSDIFLFFRRDFPHRWTLTQLSQHPVLNFLFRTSRRDWVICVGYCDFRDSVRVVRLANNA